MKTPEWIDLLRGPLVTVQWLLQAMFAVVLLALAIAHGGGLMHADTHWALPLTLIAALLTLPTPFGAVGQAVAWRRMVDARLAPRRGLAGVWRGLRQAVGLTWVLSALPLAVLAWTVPSADAADAPLAGAALVTACLALVSCAAAAWHGLIAARWLVLPLVAAVLCAAAGPQMLWSAWVAAGTAVHVAVMALVPAMWLPLRRNGGAARRMDAPAGTGLRRRWQAVTAAFSRRWPLIDGQPARIGTAMVLTQVALLMTSGSARHANGVHGGLFQQWGSAATVWHPFQVLMMGLLLSRLLRCGGLHWRELLAPVGGFRRHLGLRILWASWCTTAALLALVASCALPLLVWMHPTPPAALAEGALRVGVTFACDLALAVAIATWLRGASSQSSVAVTAFIACTFGGAVALLLAGQWTDHPTVLWHRGVLHHAGTLVLAGLFAWLADRQWRRVDLAGLWQAGQNARAGASPHAD